MYCILWIEFIVLYTFSLFRYKVNSMWLSYACKDPESNSKWPSLWGKRPPYSVATLCTGLSNLCWIIFWRWDRNFKKKLSCFVVQQLSLIYVHMISCGLFVSGYFCQSYLFFKYQLHCCLSLMTRLHPIAWFEVIVNWI